MTAACRGVAGAGANGRRTARPHLQRQRSFGGAAAPAIRRRSDRTAQMSAPIWSCASSASKPRSGSSPARSSSCSSAISSSRRKSAACRRTTSTGCRSSARRAARAAAQPRPQTLPRAGGPPAAPRPAGAAMRSIPRRIRTRPARRTRSARSLPAASRRRRLPWAPDAGEPPIGAPGGRAAGAPLDLATMGPPNGAAAGAAAAQPSRRRRAGGHAAALADAARRIRPRLWLCAAQGLRARRRRLPRLPEQISQRSARRRRHLLARRKPVPAPALPRRRGSLPQRLDQIRNAPPRRPTRCCGSGSRSPRSARRRRPARRSAKSCASIRARRRA